MLASDVDLKRLLALGRLAVEPYDEALLQPSSIDVRLDAHFLTWADGTDDIDPRRAPDMSPVVVAPGQPFRLRPGQMALGATVEHVAVDDGLAARVEGKSSLGRLGIAVHVTAGFIDPGFAGHVTLELVNHAPRDVLLWPGMRIGQLCVFPLAAPAQRPYGSAGVGSHYQHQRGPTASRAHLGWRTWPIPPSREEIFHV